MPKFKWPRLRAFTRVFLPVIVGLTVTGTSLPSALAQTGPSVRHHNVQHRSVTVTNPASGLEGMLSQLKINRTGHPQTAVSLGDPSCPTPLVTGGLTVNWSYDSDTGITLSSDAEWNAQLNCQNVAYEVIGTSLFVDQAREADGNNATCGTQGSPDVGCFGATLISIGSWGCTSGPACAGDYQESVIYEIDLPAGWEWSSGGAGCFLNPDQPAVLVCSASTPVITVPIIN